MKLDMNTSFARDEEAQMMCLGNVYRGIVIPKAGLIDVDLLVKFYESEFLREGGKIHCNTKVEDILVEPRQPLGMVGEPYFWQDVAVTGVKTTRGLIKAKKTIIAAGAWAAQLLDPLGIE